MRKCWPLLVLMGLAAASVGCEGPRGGFGQTMEDLFPPPPSEVARDAFNVYDADRRRRSVNLLATAEFGGEEPYLRTYRLLLDDPDPTVRAACLRALATHGEVEDVELILPHLEDGTSFVRWEAAKALQRFHDPAAVGPLLRVVRDDREADVRQAAASALAQYPESRVFHGLIGALNDESFSVVAEAARSLRVLTGRDFGDNGAAWMDWAERTERLFADRRPYYYPQFFRPLGLVDWFRFWDWRSEPEPRRPRGAEGERPVES